jgi:hypothetical protein
VPDQAMLYCDRRLTWGETDVLAIAQVEDALREAGVDNFTVFMPNTGGPHGRARVPPGTLLSDLEDTRRSRPCASAWMLHRLSPKRRGGQVDLLHDGVAICGATKSP